MEEMISQESMAPNKLQKKTVRYTEFEEFKESNRHKGYPNFKNIIPMYIRDVDDFSHCRLF